MSEYIDKQAFNDELAKLVPWAIETSEDNAYTQGLNDAHCALLDFPAADVAPVVHAKWVSIRWGVIMGAERFYTGCSSCHEAIPTDSMLDSVDEADLKFCPYCGAKMDA